MNIKRVSKKEKETIRIKKRVILMGMLMVLMMSAAQISNPRRVDVKTAGGRTVRPMSLKSEESVDEIEADLYAQAATDLDEAVDDGLMDDALREVKLNVLDALSEVEMLD